MKRFQSCDKTPFKFIRMEPPICPFCGSFKNEIMNWTCQTCFYDIAEAPDNWLELQNLGILFKNGDVVKDNKIIGKIDYPKMSLAQALNKIAYLSGKNE